MKSHGKAAAGITTTFHGVVTATSEVRSALNDFVNPMKTKVIWGWTAFAYLCLSNSNLMSKVSHLESFLIHNLPGESAFLQVAFFCHWLGSKQPEKKTAIFRELSLEEMNHISLLWCLLAVMSSL